MNKQYEYEQNLRGSTDNFFEKWLFWHGMTHMRPASMTSSDLAHFLHFPLLDFVGLWTVRVKNTCKIELKTQKIH